MVHQRSLRRCILLPPWSSTMGFSILKFPWISTVRKHPFVVFICPQFYLLFLVVLGLWCRVGLSLVSAGSGWSVAVTCGFSLGGCSCRRAPAAGREGSVTAARGLSGMCDLPGPGIKPASPALPGRFFTTEKPRKPPFVIFDQIFPELSRPRHPLFM